MADEQMPPMDDQQPMADDQQQQQQPDQQQPMPDWPQPMAEQPMADQATPDQQQQQQQMQQQQQQQLQQQNQQLLQQEMKLSEKYEQLTQEVTWDRIVDFLRKDRMVSFLATATLDDLENKIISDEKKNSDLEYMNTIINTINQVIANVNNNPKYAEIYCSMFAMSLDNFDQTKAQRDAIDNFVTEIKSYAKQMIDNPPKPNPPSAEDMKNQAAAQELQAKAQLLQVQAQELGVKIQMMQQGVGNPDLQQQQGGAEAGGQDKLEELQMKHEHDMELQQAKIVADQQRSQEKMEADRNLLQMKIEADKQRYEEKIKSDYIDKNVGQAPTEAGYPQI
jgi:hypothetical protein